MSETQGSEQPLRENRNKKLAKSGTRRRKIPADERLKVWVRSGGRCAICGRYLLEGGLTHQAFSLGELAHIVGQQLTKGSPRGLHELDETERDKADNLMLLCASEHDEIDRKGAVDVLTVDRLLKVKHDHEDWIRRMTGLERNRGTAILRMIGSIRGDAVELSKPAASEAVLRSDSRFPEFPLSLEHYGFEIDLRHLPGEGRSQDSYWNAAKATIDEVIAHKLKDALTRERVRHLSVFGFARLPLLVYLGSKLDDTFDVTIYQRHRSTGNWSWPESSEKVEFTLDRHPSSDLAAQGASGTGGVLILNVSGTIQPDELPEQVASLPRWILAPAHTTPSVDLISSPEALDSFTGRIRTLLSELERTDKRMPALHIFAALPLSAAIALGRARDAHIHPPFIIYDRGSEGYRGVLEIK